MYESKQRQFFWMSADVHYYRVGFFLRRSANVFRLLKCTFLILGILFYVASYLMEVVDRPNQVYFLVIGTLSSLSVVCFITPIS